MLRLQDRSRSAPSGERRRLIRHKLHTPVYASFSDPSAGMVLDLSELLDLHEDGFAVQTSERLEINQPVNVCLDLSETKVYIHGTGHVVWSDGSGRGGIRLSGLPDPARKLLKEWLLVNLLNASTNHATRVRQLAQHAEQEPPEGPALVEPLPVPSPVPVPDLSGMLSAVDAVRRELRVASLDFDAALQFITDRALSLTGGSGAALAFLTGQEMICRARAGDPAPPLGARVEAKQGLSGECIRSGRLISCEDTESDPRVDREACLALGIGSILAAPIVSDFRVVGLLEVFSPHLRAFARTHEKALDRLVELVPKEPSSVPERLDSPTVDMMPARIEATPPPYPIREPLPESESEEQEPLTGVSFRRVDIALLVLVLAIVALGLGYVLAPALQRYWVRAANETRPVVVAASTAPVRVEPAQGNSLEQIRHKAESGDPEAQYALGAHYHTGEGVPQSDSDAARWFTQAAAQGHIVAQATLGAYYWAGRGVPQDLSQAYFWSVLARAGGDEASKYRVAVLTSRMTRAQVAAAQQQADNWLRQHPHGVRADVN